MILLLINVIIIEIKKYGWSIIGGGGGRNIGVALVTSVVQSSSTSNNNTNNAQIINNKPISTLSCNNKTIGESVNHPV